MEKLNELCYWGNPCPEAVAKERTFSEFFKMWKLFLELWCKINRTKMGIEGWRIKLSIQL